MTQATDAGGSEAVLHLDLIALGPNAAPDAGAALIRSAEVLLSLPGVVDGGAIEGDESSDFNLALYFALRDFAALEPFGTDARYARFLQGDVAPLLRAFAGADVRLEGGLPAGGAYAACLAVATAEETYAWEVRDRLAAWSNGRGRSAIGLAVGERQRFRGLALVFGEAAIAKEPSTVAGFEIAWIAGKARRLG